MKSKMSVLLFLIYSSSAFAAWNAHYELDALPNVPEGFKVEFFAREPDISHVICMCFDDKGRMFVGGGPQFRLPKEDTAKDKVLILLDKKDEGKATEFKVFAEGFNCIQALAWKGKDLWVCHAPEVTICRDTDGDDVADEFIDVYTDLGPLRHGLHGFNWAPDGKLYMSQGNNTCTKDAPKVWRDLMHVVSDAPDVQPLRKYTKAEWKSKFVKPHNEESEGGILRCDPDGKGLEIWSRGMRNPWDIGYDTAFNWVAGDNDDGPEHDRVFSPFYGSHFGKRHAWSYSWTGENNPCTVPISTLFKNASGSAVGVVFNTTEQFPKQYQNCFFMGDSDGEKVYYFHPEWEGAQMKVKLETFASTPKIGASALFLPTDVEVGPDGALYVVGWGSSYGSNVAPYYKGDENVKINEGRVFRIWNTKAPVISREKWCPAKRSKPMADWTFAELMEDMGHQIPVWRVNAQDEFVRRGNAVQQDLLKALQSGTLSTGQETWTIWALGRMAPGDAAMDKIVAGFLADKNQNLRMQAVRIAAFRKAASLAPDLAALLTDGDARVRFETGLALWHMGAKDQINAIQTAAAGEKDRLCFYAQWRGMQELMTPETLKPLLKESRAGLRRAALLALLETKSLTPLDVLGFITDKDPETRQIAVLWISKAGKDLPAGPLLDMLAAPEVETRASALACLARTTLTADQQKTIAAFHAKAQGEERALALRAIASDPAILDTLWAELKNENAMVRDAALDGLLKHEKEIAAFALPRLGDAAPYQRDAAIVALASAKKLDWTPDEAQVKALQKTFNSSPDLGTRRAVTTVLSKAKGIDKSPASKVAGEIAQKASADSDQEIAEDGAKLCKKMHLEVKTAEKKAGTSVEQVMPLLAAADPKRGHDIFFRLNAPGCYNCHQLENTGNAVGPDLSDIALRGDSKYICESILDPNKVIIEGFQPATLKTKEGRVYNGLIKEENDETLTLTEAGGKSTIIEKKDLVARKTQSVSYMPDNFGEILKPDEVADLVSFLLTQKSDKGKTVKKAGGGGGDN